MFRLSIVTPEKVAYEADIRSLIAPGVDGYLGVLSQHAPLITALRPGKIEFRDADDKQHLMAVSNGFLEVSGNVATILADAVEPAEEIDIERARSAYERVKAELAELRKKGSSLRSEIESTESALERASTRIRIHGEQH